MARVIAGMTMSIDGFVEAANGSADRLHPDLADLQGDEVMNAILFVLTHKPPLIPPAQDEHLTFTFVTDGIDSAVAQAKEAAGDNAVTVVGGPNVVMQLLAAGLMDELHIDVMPVLLGSGLRLFEDIDADRLELRKIDVREVGDRTSLRFQVIEER